MKRYIKSASGLPVLLKLEFIIEVAVPEISNINSAAKMIGEDTKPKGEVLNDWNNFISFVNNQIEYNKSLRLIKAEDGKPAEGSTIPLSKYFYIVVLDDKGQPVGKLLIDFRVSTHSIVAHNTAYREKHEANAVEYADSLGYSNLIPFPTDFIVNTESFKSYEQAIYAIAGKINKLTDIASQEV